MIPAKALDSLGPTYGLTTRQLSFLPLNRTNRKPFFVSGLFNQNKFLPIRYCPITIELELVDSAYEPIIGAFGATGELEEFAASNTSLEWQLGNVQVKVDFCTLDNALDNSHASRPLSGKSLTINYNTFASQFQAISGQNPQVNASRALTRLKSVFVSFDKEKPSTAFWRKVRNGLFSPMRPDSDAATNVAKHSSNGDVAFHTQVGGQLFPEYPIRSHAEAFYQLKPRLGVQSSSFHNFDIDGHERRENAFIIGIDCEKVLEAGYLGLNTRAGYALIFKFKHNPAKEAARHADRVRVALHSDQALEIRDAGCAIFDNTHLGD
jgi:hypothetical protein